MTRKRRRKNEPPVGTPTRSETDSRVQEPNSPTRALMGLVLLLGLSSIWNPHDWRGGIDYYQFWVVGQATGAEQVGDIYSDEERGRLGAEYYQRALVDGSLLRKGAAQRRQILETYSTPFLYTVFGVLSTGDYDTDITAYNFLSLASVVLAIVAISACLGLPGMAAAAAILLFTAWFAPFLSDFAVTNVNGLQLGLLALFLWTRARARKPVHDVVGGVVLGLAVLFKPNLVFVAALLVASRLMMRRVRLLGLEAVGMLAAGVIALIATSVRFGSIAIWARWVEALRDLPDEIITIQLGNFAPVAVFGGILNVDLSAVFLVLPMAVALVVIERGRRVGGHGGGSRGTADAAVIEARHDVLVVALACLVMLLTPRLVWLHYFVMAVPAVLVLVGRDEDATESTMTRVVRGALLAIAVLGLSVTPLRALGVVTTPPETAVAVSLSVLVLFGLLCWETGRGRFTAAPPGVR